LYISVLDHNLYVIHPDRTSPSVHSRVYLFDPIFHKWSDTNGIPVSRPGPTREALVPFVDGKANVFGGNNVQIIECGHISYVKEKLFTIFPINEKFWRTVQANLVL